uniref:Uncharacterized protein n=1 Tax=Timema poppense TaxID=170557 RepID=A0A7R9HFZ5_TIMPO|nr:unnamed protein product [Timema poppensis]
MEHVQRLLMEGLVCLKCGEGPLSLVPSALYVSGMATLMHYVVAVRRPWSLRRLLRDHYVREMAFLWFLYQTLVVWVYFLRAIDVTVNGLTVWYLQNPDTPPMTLKNLMDASNRPVWPRRAKFAVCLAVSLTPGLLLLALYQGETLTTALGWGFIHRPRTEIGISAYYLVRPLNVGGDHGETRQDTRVSFSASSVASDASEQPRRRRRSV